jgi:F0F1-type ATP synthase membrane subunit b/b'
VSAAQTQVGAQTRHLLEVVRRRREEQCSRVLEQARNQSRQIIRNAYQEARNRTRQDILDLREQIRAQLASAQAREQTRQRHARQRVDRELVEATWQPLQDALLRRWLQPAVRREWIATLIRQASITLIDTHWNIEHPPDWPLQECNDLKAKLSNGIDCFPNFEARPTIAAGLCICAGGACVDGTLEGLLHGRSHIEALLLAAIRKRRGEEG